MLLPTLERSEVPANRFAAAVERRLYGSSHRDVFVYVHGYKAEFTYPVLVAAELWHYLGYNGAFVAYSWTATPNPLAYFKDIESAAQTARNLRLQLEFLADRTSARRIHVLGYSAGTRVVTGALHQLALEHSGASREELADILRLGHVVLVGADVDRDLLAGYVDDGLLDLPETFTVYQSAEDGPLGLAERVFGRHRTGQLTDNEVTRDSALFHQAHPWFHVIDVTPAEGGTKGNGHGYFLKSPWASNDILLTFWTGLPPGERGLVQRGDGLRWTFPDDYVERLRASMGAAEAGP